jgi:coenzyme F420 hydrogenase subunit beta
MFKSVADVVKADCCVGCGVCMFDSGQDTKMLLNKYGEYFPVPGSTLVNDAVCPFITNDIFSPNESELSRKIFVSEEKLKYSDFSGYYHSVFAGFANEHDLRSLGSSGGMVSWILIELLKSNLVDFVIHVRAKPRKLSDSFEPLYEYSISSNSKEIGESAHSHYHAVEMSKVLETVSRVPGRYVFVGVPCFVKAIRRLCDSEEVYRSRIKFCISLVCGHMKSVNWSYLYGSHALPSLSVFGGIKFRLKEEHPSPTAYMVGVVKTDGSKIVLNAANIPGGRYNLGSHMLNACNYCDDVVGELADISFGDAWLPDYIKDPSGTNLIIVRNKVLLEILLKGEKDSRVVLNELPESAVFEAQSGAFRQRRNALGFRLSVLRVFGFPYPLKRTHLFPRNYNPFRFIVYALRWYISKQSKIWFIRSLERNSMTAYHFKIICFGQLLRFFELVCAPKLIFSRLLRRRK